MLISLAKMAKRKDEPKTGIASSKARGRVIQPIEFTQAQWDAILKAATMEGLKGGPWVRAQALREARKLGYWNPEAETGGRDE